MRAIGQNKTGGQDKHKQNKDKDDQKKKHPMKID
jgi:hypothetical protein